MFVADETMESRLIMGRPWDVDGLKPADTAVDTTRSLVGSPSVRVWLFTLAWEDGSRDSGMGRHGTLKPQMLNENLGVTQWTSSLVDPGLGSLIVIAFMVRVLVRQWSSHFPAVEMIGDEMLRKCGYVGIFYNVYPRNIYQVFRESQKKLTKLSPADQPDSIDLRDDPGICLVDEVVLWLSRSVRGTLHGNVPFGRSAGRPRTPLVSCLLLMVAERQYRKGVLLSSCQQYSWAHRYQRNPKDQIWSNMGPRSKTQRGKNCCGWQSSAGQIQDFCPNLVLSFETPRLPIQIHLIAIPDSHSQVWKNGPYFFLLRGGCIIDAPKLRSAMNGSRPKHVQKQCWGWTWIGCICVCYVHLISSYFICYIFVHIQLLWLQLTCHLLVILGFSELTTLLAAAFALIPAARNVRKPSWS